jgi:2'-5' RNA ligase
MAFAINLTARDSAGARIRQLWDAFGAFELVPSMAALNHPPHITLAIYDRIGEDHLRGGMHQIMAGQSPFRLRFSAIARFEQPSLVFWAAPDPSARLLQIHASLHRLIDPALCRQHYRPGNWVPHCTLATDVTDANRSVARYVAARPFEPFDIVFDSADCVEFVPVRLIDEVVLVA